MVSWIGYIRIIRHHREAVSSNHTYTMKRNHQSSDIAVRQYRVSLICRFGNIFQDSSDTAAKQYRVVVSKFEGESSNIAVRQYRVVSEILAFKVLFKTLQTPPRSSNRVFCSIRPYVVYRYIIE